MNENPKTQSFAGWLWHGLRNTIGLSAKSRSDREIRLGMFLLLSQVIWVVLPSSPVIYTLLFGQVLLGIALILHGNYLKSSELAEEGRGRKIQMREFHIRYIAERDGLDLEEAAKKADETDWRDQEGRRVPPPWIDKEKEKVNDDL